VYKLERTKKRHGSFLLNSQLQKKLLAFFQQLVKALIKPLLKVLRLEERKIPLKRQKIMLTGFIAWIYSQL